MLSDLRLLRRLEEVPADVTLGMVDEHRLRGRGLSWADVSLLAACRQSRAQLWTRDRPLRAAAAALGVLADRA